MDDETDRDLRTLIDAAQAAYDRVHLEVVERIPPPARIDLTRLDENQRWAVEQLRDAERALAEHRARSYA